MCIKGEARIKATNRDIYNCLLDNIFVRVMPIRQYDIFLKVIIPIRQYDIYVWVMLAVEGWWG